MTCLQYMNCFRQLLVDITFTGRTRNIKAEEDLVRRLTEDSIAGTGTLSFQPVQAHYTILLP